MQELCDLAVRLKQLDRCPGQFITFGVAADEPPGRSLSEARLLLVVLDYVTAEDWGLSNRISPQELKLKRLERLCTQSYEQGVALSQPNLAHLLGISSDAVQSTIKKHDQVILPTRGRVADRGSKLLGDKHGIDNKTSEGKLNTHFALKTLQFYRPELFNSYMD